MKRVISGLLTLGLTATLALSADRAQDRAAASPATQPAVTLLDLHPVDPANYPDEPALAGGLPRVISGADAGAASADQRQIHMPAVVTPGQSQRMRLRAMPMVKPVPGSSSVTTAPC